MAQAVEEWYKQMPIITRSYLTAAVVTTVGCSLEVFIRLLKFLFSFLRSHLADVEQKSRFLVF